jgi:hypothetical protein
MPDSDASRHGRGYYCVGLYDEREAYVFADEVVFHENGDLIFLGRGTRNEGHASADEATPEVMLAFAPAYWSFVYAASVVDGHAVAVAHWPHPPEPLADEDSDIHAS